MLKDNNGSNLEALVKLAFIFNLKRKLMSSEVISY